MKLTKIILQFPKDPVVRGKEHDMLNCVQANVFSTGKLDALHEKNPKP